MNRCAVIRTKGYGSGVWIACASGVWMRILHLELQPYVYIYIYGYIYMDIYNIMPFIWMIWYRKCAVVNHSRPKRPDAQIFVAASPSIQWRWDRSTSSHFAGKIGLLSSSPRRTQSYRTIDSTGTDLMRVGRLFAKLLDRSSPQRPLRKDSVC
jgi:hypothetical protein